MEMVDGPQVLGEVVRHAIETRTKVPGNYRNILDSIRVAIREGQNETLKRWLMSLRECVSALNERAAELLKIVLEIRWREFSPAVLECMSEFVVALVSAHSVHGAACIDMLVQLYVIDDPVPAAGASLGALPTIVSTSAAAAAASGSASLGATHPAASASSIAASTLSTLLSSSSSTSSVLLSSARTTPTTSLLFPLPNSAASGVGSRGARSPLVPPGRPGGTSALFSTSTSTSSSSSLTTTTTTTTTTTSAASVPFPAPMAHTLYSASSSTTTSSSSSSLVSSFSATPTPMATSSSTSTSIATTTAAAVPSAADSSKVTDTALREVVHETLYHLLDIAPMLQRFVTDSIRKHFPLKWSSAATLAAFTCSVLELQRYLPDLSQNIFSLCIDQMITIDVDIKEEEEEEEEEDDDNGDEDEGVKIGSKEDEAHATQFMLEEDGVDTPGMAAARGRAVGALGKDTAGTSAVVVPVSDTDRRRGKAREMSAMDAASEEARGKLDGMMWLCMETVHALLRPDSSEFTPEHRRAFFLFLLKEFERCVLPTHKVKHVQFLLFQACSYSQDYAAMFVDRLFTLATSSEGSATVLRESSFLYIASFLARANFLSVDFVDATLRSVAGFVHEYQAQHRRTDLARHRVFYSACQALFYMLCFRIDEMQENQKDIACLQIASIVGSDMLPLAFCSQQVVNVFQGVAERHSIIYCRPYTRVPSQGLARATADGMAVVDRLDDFFPFDPYTLPRSRVHVEDKYKEWVPVAVESEGETGDEREEDDYINSRDAEEGRAAASRLDTTALVSAAAMLVRKRSRTVSGQSGGSSVEERGFVGSPLVQEMRRKRGMHA